MSRRHLLLPLSVLLICLWSWVTLQPTTAANDAIVISEIMYHPADVGTEYPNFEYREDAEFIELYNSSGTAVDLSYWSFADGIDYIFPAGTIVNADDYLVLAKDAVLFNSVYGFAPDDVYEGQLANDGETIILLDNLSTTIAQVTYSDGGLWPVLPDALGSSLELIDPTAANGDPANWATATAGAGHTAGSANSVGQSGVPPLVLAQSAPTNVPANQSITVSATITAATSAELVYLVDFGTAVTLTMTALGATTFETTIPGQAAGSLVRYRILATGAGGTRSGPRLDDSINWWGVVVSNGSTSDLPIYRWFVDPNDYATARANRNSNTPCNGSLCPAVIAYDGRVWDNVGFRVAGNTSRGQNKKHWRFEFPKNHLFDAPFLDVSLDTLTMDAGYPNYDMVREQLSWETAEVLGFPGLQMQQMRMEQNGAFYGLYLLREEQDGVWRERHDLEDGALYKFDNGADKQGWSGGWTKKTQLDQPNGDLADLRDCVLLLGNPATQEVCLNELLDVPAVIHEVATIALFRNIDQREFNFFLYQDAETKLWRIIPDDLDRTWGLNGTAQLSSPVTSLEKADRRCDGTDTTPANEVCRAILNVPTFRAMYYRHLRTLVDEYLVVGVPEDRINELMGEIAAEFALDEAKWNRFSGQPITYHQDKLINVFLPAWRTHLTSGGWNGEIPAAQSAAPTIVFSSTLDYSPASGNQLEEYFVLENDTDEYVDISGWTISNAVTMTIPSGTVIPPHGWVHIGRDVVASRNRAISPTGNEGHGVVGGYTDFLPNTGGTIELYDRQGGFVDSLTYGPTGAPFSGELIISEIQYNPQAGEAFEFIEFKNNSGTAVDVSGVSVAGGIDYTFPAGTTIAAGGYLAIAEDVAAFESRYLDSDSAYYEATLAVSDNRWHGELSNDGEELIVYAADGVELFRLTYNDAGAWSGRADGKGSAAELIDPAAVPATQPEKNLYLNDGNNWRSTSEYHGSPGRLGLGPDKRVVVNEVLAHTDLPQVDSIEFYNTTAAPIDISYWFISDNSDDYVKYKIPAVTMIAGNGFALFDETDFNSAGNPFKDFGLSSSKGDDIYLLEADAAGNLLRFVDTAEFGPTPNGESIGLLPDGEGDFVRLCQLSPGSSNSNSGFCHGPVVINEIHYNPAGADDNVEYIELMNFGNTTESFDNWQLRGDVDLDFAAGISLAPQEALLIVAFDPITDTAALDNFRTTYRLDPAVQIIGPWEGNRLDNGGGTIKLYRPDEPSAGETFYPMLLEDMVEYDDDPPWPTEPDSGGPSLELIDWQTDNRQPNNWEPSLSNLGTPGRDNRDDNPPISAADVLVFENMTTAEFAVTLAHASGLTVTVDYTTAVGSASAADFTSASGTLTFPPGEISQTAVVAIINDAIDEPLEQFTLLLSNPEHGYIADDTAVGSISDDDDPPGLSINDVSVVEGDANTTTAIFLVTLSASSGQTVTVDYDTQAQTATAADDYLSAAGTVTFAPGETAQTVAIMVQGDTLFEDDETFVVMLSNPTNASLTDDTGIGTIIDNEGVPSLFIDDVQIAEGDSGSQTAVFTVRLSLAAEDTITVDYTTADESALAGEDYTAVSGQLTFTAGTLSQTISVTIMGDEVVEPDETFLVQLSNATSGALISDGQAVGTIFNDDSSYSVFAPLIVRP